jgi:hypothetical protein
VAVAATRDMDRGKGVKMARHADGIGQVAAGAIVGDPAARWTNGASLFRWTMLIPRC